MTQQGDDVLTHVMVAGALLKRLSLIVVMAQRYRAGLSKLSCAQSCQTKRRMAHELRLHEFFGFGGKTAGRFTP